MQGWPALALLAALLAGPVAADREERERECTRIKERIERIHQRRRAGYSAREGRRLKARLRELEQRRRKACRYDQPS